MTENLLGLAYLFVAKNSWLLAVLGGFGAGFFGILGASAKQETLKAQALIVLSAVCAALGVLSSFLFNTFIAPKYNVNGVSYSFVLVFFVGALVGAVAAMIFERFMPQKIDGLRSKLTAKSALERNQRSDIREIEEFIPKAREAYNPADFYDQTKGIFLGLGEDGEPIYWTDPKFPHVQVTGTTGTGKGVFISSVGVQQVLFGAALVYIDPKDDEWAPHVFYDAATRAGKSYQFINLSAPTAQINLFDGASAAEIETMFLAGFSLNETGKKADFYSIADRRAARIVADAYVQGQTPAMLFEQWRGSLADTVAVNTGGNKKGDTAANFLGKLEEMAVVPAVNAAEGGVDLAALVENGGCLYVVGSMDNAKILRLQKILLLRMLQLARRRSRLGDSPLRQVLVVADEFKYHISKPALEALGAGRDKSFSVIMAHQSIGDLRDCPADLSPDAVVDSVEENAKLKLIYQLQSVVTAEYFAAKSGNIQVDDEMRKVEKNIALAERVLPERSIKQAERYYIDTNMFMSMLSGWGVIFRPGARATFGFVSPLRVPKRAEAIEVYRIPAHVNWGESPKPENLI